MGKLNRYVILGAVLAIAIVVGIVFYSTHANKNTVTLEDVFAAVYVGTSALSENSKGVTVFIQEDGTIQQMTRDNIEWGTVINTADDIVLNGQDHITLVDKGTGNVHTVKSECSVHSGYQNSSGYLKTSGIYYELFNHGFEDYDENASNYRSVLRWGNEKQHDCTDVPHYLVADGSDEESIFMMTTKMIGDGEFGELYILQYTPKGNEFQIKEATLREDTLELSLSNIVSNSTHLYVMYLWEEDSRDEEELRVLKVNKETLELEDDFLVGTYPAEEDPYFFPFNQDAFHVTEKELYFVTGYGEVQQMDLQNGAAKTLFTLEDYTRGEWDIDEHITFNDDQLYFIRFHEQKDVHVIDVYSLGGERTATYDVPELQKMEKKGFQTRYIQDFEIIN
ncbi:hypothetical protein P4637_04745 [Halalkalibacterium halodurans]|uniref:BH3844 protein n=1 Tax=Halalkalibacterium halodurans (strain ATCC BAA-125 / DSM 18197 / FERM 7344 / JCM 9153 / C-125) TaxID=272558 RepID=Q9K688_HALH5|nr:hypothetical protein [Halalkalibacterium halodurans]MED4079553.1 hypothetical protein [Halalkalibacterium halodurans]MED4084170.1 hypothetical protein [Halalkalibacterium halodurans]MED4104648.1 hypothetical protein [Halalkalibacterium halodurans]MED4108376.1 hypothetical protein [Halalkalibacterium halodurans]MED4147397.1 hypothetical protein [Halalkalibacterium halodurans]